VALKIIKPGMDTREVIARFEAERQALALMDRKQLSNQRRLADADGCGGVTVGHGEIQHPGGARGAD